MHMICMNVIYDYSMMYVMLWIYDMDAHVMDVLSFIYVDAVCDDLYGMQCL